MATRKKMTSPEKEPEYKKEICDNCGLAKWVTHMQRHYDKQGKPICLVCPHEEFFIVRGTKACQHFVRKNPST